MIAFLLIFFSLYTLMHTYVFFKVRSALPLGLKSGILLGLFMGVMILAPILVRFSERAGMEGAARLLAYVGYSWLGMVFLFFCCSLAIDLLRLLASTAGPLLPAVDLKGWILSPGRAFLLSVSFAVLVLLYGHFEANSIRTERVVIETDKIPPAMDRIRIAQISDVHLGLIVRERRLKRILEKVKESRPDILVSTGDLVDGQINDLSGLYGLFQEINPPHGKFAITGNHEFYAGLPQSLDFIHKAGFRLLRGEVFPGVVTLVGVDDPQGKALNLSQGRSERSLLSGLNRGSFVLLLKHRPLLEGGSPGLFDLQLSGHVHKGQIFPFGLVIKLLYPLDEGCMVLQGGSRMCVSRGSGTWGPPFRFLAPPEVKIIDLVRRG